MVASEPSLMLSGRARYFLDVPGRPGMSGSPVYAIRGVAALPAEADKIMNDPNIDAIEKLAAVSPQRLGNREGPALGELFAGALVEGSERSLGLGFCWHSALIEEIFRKPRYGTNPEPPSFQRPLTKLRRPASLTECRTRMAERKDCQEKSCRAPMKTFNSPMVAGQRARWIATRATPRSRMTLQEQMRFTRTAVRHRRRRDSGPSSEFQ